MSQALPMPTFYRLTRLLSKVLTALTPGFPPLGSCCHCQTPIEPDEFECEDCWYQTRVF